MAEGQDIDVEQVMERVREAVRRRRSLAETPERPAAPDHGAEAADFGHLQSVGDLRYVTVGSHRALLGPVVVAIKKTMLKLLTPMLEQQAAYNAAAIRAMADTDNRMQAMGWRYDQAFARSQERLGADVSDLRRELRDGIARVQDDVFGRVVNEADARHATLRQDLLAVHQEILDLRRGLEAQDASTRRADARLGVSERRLEASERRLGASERRWRRVRHWLETGARPEAPPDAPSRPERPALTPDALEPEFDYAGFEAHFRGDEADIKERQRIYLPLFEGAPDVLDLGCGRGEFLELLHERGIAGQGVDLDLDMVLLCRDKGLDARREDAFAHLAARADETVGGIFAAQLIEHLDPPRIIEIVKLAYRKLVPGGCLVLETPNPACLMVFADSFYRDLSHVRPIHADTMKFLYEAAGFRKVEVKPLAPVDPALRVPPLRPEDPALASFNQGIERLNTLLFGFQDYAVIGRKGRVSGPDA